MADPKATSSASMKCFLIDDDADDQEIFTMALQALDNSIHCYFAGNGVKALEKLQGDNSFLPHFIFIDINMPRMNGIECLEEIRKVSRLEGIPVCMVSTATDPSIVKKTKELGASDFIVNPPSISDLSTRLHQFFHLNARLQ